MINFLFQFFHREQQQQKNFEKSKCICSIEFLVFKLVLNLPRSFFK